MTLRARGCSSCSAASCSFALLAAGAAPLGWDLPGHNRASKIRVHPRGNLWATGESSGFERSPPLPPSFCSGLSKQGH